LNLKTGHLTSHWAATKSGAHFVEAGYPVDSGNPNM